MARKGQNLFSYYRDLKEKMKFIRRVARRCDLSSNAVSNWVFGNCKPSEQKYINILVEETGISADNLFNHDLDEKH